MTEAPAAPRPPSRIRRILRRTGRAAFASAIAIAWLWMALATYFADTHGGGRRPWTAALLGASALAALRFLRRRRLGLLAFAALFAAVLGWFCSLRPSNDRDWAPGCERLAWGEASGDDLLLHGVRDFRWRTAGDFTPRWEDRRYDLSRARTVDLILSYWDSSPFAHVMVSFGFDDGRFLVASVETRKEKGEGYSPLQGLLRQYEKICVFGDERDVLRLRTETRGERVYLFRTAATPDQARRILASYVAAANRLKDQPEFYNSLTGNCASAVVTRVKDAGLPEDPTWETVLSGYMYAEGMLDTRLPLAELRERGHLNAAAHAAGDGEDFSQRIREGVPGPETPH